MYDILHLKGVPSVHDKTRVYRLGAGLQFRLPKLILWTVGLDAFLENSSKGVDVFSQAIKKEAEIDVPRFICTSAIVIPLDETSPV